MDHDITSPFGRYFRVPLALPAVSVKVHPAVIFTLPYVFFMPREPSTLLANKPMGKGDATGLVTNTEGVRIAAKTGVMAMSTTIDTEGILWTILGEMRSIGTMADVTVITATSENKRGTTRGTFMEVGLLSMADWVMFSSKHGIVGGWSGLIMVAHDARGNIRMDASIYSCLEETVPSVLSTSNPEVPSFC